QRTGRAWTCRALARGTRLLRAGALLLHWRLHGCVNRTLDRLHPWKRAWCAVIARWTGFTDAIALVLLGGIGAGLVAALVGFLLARYREIFFAMLSLALSMILYGVLVKTESLGSTDGFSVATPTFLGYAPHGQALGLSLYWLTLAVDAIAAVLVGSYFRSVTGALATPIRHNQIRARIM